MRFRYCTSLISKCAYAVLGCFWLFLTSEPSILIVDDDIAILQCFSKIFQRKGYTVAVAKKGAEAIEKLSHSRFDVALVDLALPDMEGTALFPLIKKSSPKTVRIMLTGKTWMQNSIAGADAFVGKPVNPEKLLSIIDSELKNREAEI
jgi:DNA-binding NtrC family response regulator